METTTMGEIGDDPKRIIVIPETQPERRRERKPEREPQKEPEKV